MDLYPVQRSLPGNATDGQVLVFDGSQWVAQDPVSSASITLNVVLDGGGAPLEQGDFVDLVVPFNSSLQNITLVSSASGSAEVDVLSCSYSSYPTMSSMVGPGTPPQVANGYKYTDSSFTSWTSTSLSQGDIIRVYIDSNATGITRLTTSIRIG